MKINKLNKILLSVALLFMVTYGVFAQADVSSPYSRFGLGVISQGGSSTLQQGMGGLGNAIYGGSMLNKTNPASYAAMDTLTFLFDAGFYMKKVTYRTDRLTEKGSNSSFDYASVGFGLTNWWKTGLGIVPATNKDYDALIGDVNPVSYKQSFEGGGGINELYWANGFKVTDRLFLGVTGSFLFGSISDETTIYFPDSTLMTAGRSTMTTHVRNFKFDLGAIYTAKLRGNASLIFGLTYHMPSDMKCNRDLFIRSITSYSTTTELPIDTLKYEKNGDTKLKYPQGFGVGVTYKKERFMLGIDFNWDNWKGFSMNGINDSLQNSWNIAAGGSYKPKSTSISRYYTKITYRFGIHYDQTYFRIYDTSINRFGVTAGLNLPMPRSRSSFNIAFEVGKMGTTDNGLVSQTYFNVSIGMSIHDTWFVKRKYM